MGPPRAVAWASTNQLCLARPPCTPSRCTHGELATLAAASQEGLLAPNPFLEMPNRVQVMNTGRTPALQRPRTWPSGRPSSCTFGSCSPALARPLIPPTSSWTESSSTGRRVSPLDPLAVAGQGVPWQGRHVVAHCQRSDGCYTTGTYLLHKLVEELPVAAAFAAAFSAMVYYPVNLGVSRSRG